MTLEIDSLAAACCATRQAQGYPPDDQLLRDLRGRNGDLVRAVATGYVMGLHDSGAGCLGAEALLRYLRCQAGEAMSHAGRGYVMAVRDGMGSARRHGGDAPSREARATMREDVERVTAWLEHRRNEPSGCAISAIRAALTEPAMASPRVLRWFGQGSHWLRATVGMSGLRAMLITTAAGCGALGIATWSSAQDRLLDHELQLSEQASSATALLLEQRRYEMDSFINIADRHALQTCGRKWKRARDSMLGTLDRLDGLELDETDRQAVLEMSRDFRLYADGYARLLSQMETGRVRTAQDANQQFEAYKGVAHRVEEIGAELAARAANRLGA